MLEVLMFLEVLSAAYGDENMTVVPAPEVLQIISSLSPLVPATCTSGGNLCKNEANDKDCADIFSPPNTNVFP